MTLPFSMSIAVGQASSSDGKAVVYLVTDNERTALTPKAARKVAAELLLWSEHAEEWMKLDHDERERRWLKWELDLIDTGDGAEAQRRAGAA